MAEKTIVAEIDGIKRTIKADIPDGASPQDIEGAVRDYWKANPKLANESRNLQGTARTLAQRKTSTSSEKPATASDYGEFATDVASRAAIPASLMLAGPGVVSAGSALMKGASGPALRLAAGYVTYDAADRLLKTTGLPWWVREPLTLLVGGKVAGAMSPEVAEIVKAKGVKGAVKHLVSEWVNGGAKAEQEFPSAGKVAQQMRRGVPTSETPGQSFGPAPPRRVAKPAGGGAPTTPETPKETSFEDFPNRGKLGKQFAKKPPTSETPGQTFGSAPSKGGPRSKLSTPDAPTAGATEAPGGNAKLLDDIAKANAGKLYAKLSPEQQATVQKIAKTLDTPQKVEAATKLKGALEPSPNSKLRTPADEPSGPTKTVTGGEVDANTISKRNEVVSKMLAEDPAMTGDKFRSMSTQQQNELIAKHWPKHNMKPDRIMKDPLKIDEWAKWIDRARRK